MLTVAPDGRRDNRRGGKGLDDSRPRDENQTRASDTRLRAILRAPAEVQQWYRDDVISQKVAAKLGPRRQTPERAAHIREVVNAVATFVHPKAHDPSSRKQVDAYVRRMLGVKTVDPVDRVLGMVSKFNAEQRRRFLQGLESLGMARRSSGS